MIRVFIDSASHVARAGLGAMLEDAEGIERVLDPTDADVIVRDDLGPAAAQAIPSTPIVLLRDTPMTGYDIAEGIRALLPREADAAQIAAAIQAVASGLVAVALESATGLLARVPGAAPMEDLTARELQVLEALADGLSNKQIAARLEISENTAKFHMNSIFGKLGAGTRTEAVTKGIRAGLLKI